MAALGTNAPSTRATPAEAAVRSLLGVQPLDCSWYWVGGGHGKFTAPVVSVTAVNKATIKSRGRSSSMHPEKKAPRAKGCYLPS